MWKGQLIWLHWRKYINCRNCFPLWKLASLLSFNTHQNSSHSKVSLPGFLDCTHPPFFFHQKNLRILINTSDRKICLLSRMHEDVRKICWFHQNPAVLYFFNAHKFICSPQRPMGIPGDEAEPWQSLYREGGTLWYSCAVALSPDRVHWQPFPAGFRAVWMLLCFCSVNREEA